MMKTISIGKLRAIQQCTSPQRTFTCLALDHRQNLRKANPVYRSNEELSRFKLDITRELAVHATAVLLDPEVSASQSIATGVLPGNRGLVVALESTGYQGSSTERRSNLLSGWTVAKAKRMGANMVKLLVYYHPSSQTASEIADLICKVADDCISADIGLMIEPLSYSLDDAKLSSDEKRRIVVETASKLTSIPGVDILKAELPLDIQENDLKKMAEACSEVSAASEIPWILLSASVPYNTFFEQARVACEAGASGIAVGRAVWQEAVKMGIDERRAFLSTTAKDRLITLTNLCCSYGKPWTDFYCSEAGFNWYQTYGL
jgi:tagatose 1,6-diphosphate aldolase